jgi:hypothetical protein
MSLVVSWIAVHHKAASLYIASDSRISWGASHHWDHAQKVFALTTTSELFGYAGDVLFPTQTLSQLSHLAQTGVLFERDEQPHKRAERYAKLITSALESYPKDCLAESFDILYACCNDGTFSLFRLSFVSSSKLSSTQIEVPNKSGPIEILGSGREPFETQYKQEPQTSYAVFHALAKVIDAKSDPKVGGIPQAVSLYSDGRTNVYGLSYFGTAALLGLEVAAPGCPPAVEWRNENFEGWDFIAKKLKQGTQRQPRLVRKLRQFLP